MTDHSQPSVDRLNLPRSSRSVRLSSSSFGIDRAAARRDTTADSSPDLLGAEARPSHLGTVEEVPSRSDAPTSARRRAASRSSSPPPPPSASSPSHPPSPRPRRPTSSSTAAVGATAAASASGGPSATPSATTATAPPTRRGRAAQILDHYYGGTTAGSVSPVPGHLRRHPAPRRQLPGRRGRRSGAAVATTPRRLRLRSAAPSRSCAPPARGPSAPPRLRRAWTTVGSTAASPTSGCCRRWPRLDLLLRHSPATAR